MQETREGIRTRLAEDGKEPWMLFGPYLSERAWATVREDYSAGGDAWSYFPHDHARSKAYRWSEDVKEVFFYLDSTPTHSYLKMNYKYPHAGVSLRRSH
jgi:hypothetical protein